MATAVPKLTLEEFECQYDGLKPHVEYWFGEAVPKAMPTWLHGLLQYLLMNALYAQGFIPASEVRLKLSRDFQPVPDVIATLGLVDLPYPTKAFDVAIEILSPEDSFRRVTQKCRIYAEWGISNVFVIDPEMRQAWIWDHESHGLHEVVALNLNNGRAITLEQIFAELDVLLQKNA